MRKNRKCFWFFALAVLTTACTLDAYDTTSTKVKEKEENKPLSETWSTIPEGNACLNVVYYVPADMDTIPKWHKRLSGITLEMQDFFHKNLQRYQYDKTFGLVVNDSNTTFIEVDYIKSKYAASKLQLEDANSMTDEILAYYAEHPDKKRSNHFMVYMPAYEGSFINCAFANPSNVEVPDHGFAFAGVDHEKFDPKFFDSARGLKAYLTDMGEVMYTLFHSFFQGDNGGSVAAAQYPLSGRIGNMVKKPASGTLKWSEHYANYWKYATVDPAKINLTETDAVWLSEIQVFNQKEEHAYQPINVTVEKVELYYKEEEETIYADCFFRSDDEIVAVIGYNDPWRTLTNPLYPQFKNPEDTELNRNEMTYTGGDGIAYCVLAENFQREGDLYHVSFVMPYTDLHPNNTAYTSYDTSIKDDPNTPLQETSMVFDAEIRFRFIGKGGMAYPHPSVSVKGAWDSPIRWAYRCNLLKEPNSGWTPVYYPYPDINKRYGSTGE